MVICVQRPKEEKVKSILSLLLACFTLIGCGGMEVRNDPSPSPLDVNYNAALLEACGNINQGQVGCSFGRDEIPQGNLTIHTPLGGTITLFSRACGIDRRHYYKNGGSYSWPIEELLPLGVKFCEVSVLVNWELPPKISTVYPIRGVKGSLYLRRRPPETSPAKLEWAPQVGITNSYLGTIYAQFRAMSDLPPPVPASNIDDGQLLNYDASYHWPIDVYLMPDKQLMSEPLLLRVMLNEETGPGGGLWQLYGCGHGVESQPLTSGQTMIEIKRDTILGAEPKPGTCVLFGWAVDGEKLLDEFTVAINVFDKKHVHLGADAWADDGKICYAVPATVSVAVYGMQTSNELEDCFDLSGEVEYLGFFTNVGRAKYAVVGIDGEINWVQ